MLDVLQAAIRRRIARIKSSLEEQGSGPVGHFLFEPDIDAIRLVAVGDFPVCTRDHSGLGRKDMATAANLEPETDVRMGPVYLVPLVLKLGEIKGGVIFEWHRLHLGEVSPKARQHLADFQLTLEQGTLVTLRGNKQLKLRYVPQKRSRLGSQLFMQQHRHVAPPEGRPGIDLEIFFRKTNQCLIFALLAVQHERGDLLPFQLLKGRQNHIPIGLQVHSHHVRPPLGIEGRY